jgi:DNA (cytosine-5)-methyltransferase 1
MSVGYEPEYWVTARLVEAADYGVPQSRQRIFIVATRRSLTPYVFPKSTHSRSALLRILKSGEYWNRYDIPRPRNISLPQNGITEPDGTRPWRTVRDALLGLQPPAENEEEAIMNHWRIPGARAYAGHSGSTLDWPAKTIKAGVHGVPGGENTVIDDLGKFRYFTLREAARIQTFPDDHLFKGARIHITRQIGNAVPCDLAAALARPLYDLIKKVLTSQRRND